MPPVPPNSVDSEALEDCLGSTGFLRQRPWTPCVISLHRLVQDRRLSCARTRQTQARKQRQTVLLQTHTSTSTVNGRSAGHAPHHERKQIRSQFIGCACSSGVKWLRLNKAGVNTKEKTDWEELWVVVVARDSLYELALAPMTRGPAGGPGLWRWLRRLGLMAFAPSFQPSIATVLPIFLRRPNNSSILNLHLLRRRSTRMNEQDLS